MSLDKRLNQILDGGDRGPIVTEQEIAEAIEAIKQLFIDEGWVPRAAYLSGYEVVGQKMLSTMMTGPEWLARFEKELETLRIVTESKQDHWVIQHKLDIMKAARRASGVSDD